MIRLIGNVAMQKEAVRVGWDDYRKIRVYGDEGEVDYVFDATLRGRKHPREAAEGEQPPVNIEEAKPAHYFILCMDELTDRLFRVDSDGEKRSQFFGVPLPPLMFTPQGTCTA
ncbi:hypothetical protein STCU_03203 [Strigomonas culicis]|nr:hypothetical protein STCU_03203 [Strigomonas culicis]|eukprot:EPY31822.1 hypothetical protein STCU_03203 [Strigomonas culicis]